MGELQLRRTTFRKGYNRVQVMQRIDALMALTDAVESGSLFREQAAEEARRIADEPFQMETGGFRQEDVEACFADLIGKL